MKRRVVPGKLIAGLLLIAVVAVAGWWFNSRRAKASTVTLGRTVNALRGDMTTKVSETGTLEPIVKVDVKSRVGGRLKRIYVREGQTVRAGDTIALVDAAEVERQVAGIRAQLASAEANLHQAEENYTLTRRQNALAVSRAKAALQSAEARLRQTRAGTRRQDIGSGEQSLRQAEARLVDAQRNYARRQHLEEKGFIARAEVDTAQTAVAVAQTDVASAKERLSLLKEGPRVEEIATAEAGVREARLQVDTALVGQADAQLRLRDVERARAQVAQIQNELAQQSVQLTETRILAPISGEVVRKYVEEGELVASATAGFAQGAALVTVADLTRMQVRVNINEVDVAKIKVGDPVEIRVDGIASTTFSGRVASIAPASTAALTATAGGGSGGGDTGVVRFEVKIAVGNKDKRLRPGMTAATDVILAKRKSVVVLPQEAILPGDKVMVVTGSGEKVVKTERPITVGLRNEAQAEIVSGLRSGERVEVPALDAKDRRKININGPD